MKQLTHLFKAVQSIRTWLFVLMVGLAGDASAAVTSLRFNSEPGDYIGGGQQLFLTPSNGTFSASYNFSNYVSITFSGPSHNFALNFAAPQNQQLVVGTYEGAMRFPDADTPRLDVYGDGRGCNQMMGRFEVKQVLYGSGQQFKFWATFEQHCEGALPALFGEIRFNADVPVVLNAPESFLVVEGGMLSFMVNATDLQNRRVTLTASNIPPGASFVDNGNSTGTFTWSPVRGQADVYRVNFHGENGLGASDDASTSIQVTIAGDDIGNARPIIALPYTSTLDTTAATTANDDPYSCTYPRHTVWYALTATNRVRLRASTSGSDYATVLSVFTGSRGSLLAVGCMEDFGGLQPEVVFDTVAGRTYYFMVGTGESSQEGGNLVFSVNALVPPPNDEITSATTISALPYTHVLDTTGAITANDDPYYCGYHGHTVWYTFTPTVPLRIEASTAGSDYETALSVFTGTRGALNLVVCDDGDDDRPFSVATFNAVAGRRYYFMIAGSGGRLAFSVSPVLPPPNDDFDRATVITGLPYTDLLNTSLATTNVDDPTSCNQPGTTVWYSFTPTQDLFVEADARASDYSVVLSVHSGSRGALEQVACFGGAEVRFPAFAGTTYFIMAGSYFGDQGGHLALTLSGRPKLKVGISIDEVAGVDTKIGAATIQGTVTCSQPVTINLNGLLRQTVGRFHVIAGEFGTPYYFPGSPEPFLVRCSGQTPWSVRIFSDDGAFGGGYAFASAYAFAFAANDSAIAETSGTIHLNGSKRVKLDPDKAQLVSLQTSPSGAVLLQSILVMGHTNVLEVSSNFRDWTPVDTNVPVSNPVDWVDRAGPSPRFYRIVTLP